MFEALADLPLDEFAEAGLLLLVWSEVLGESIILASDNAFAERLTIDAVVYRASELKALLECRAVPLSEQELRRIHGLKRELLARGTPVLIEDVVEEAVAAG